MKYCSKCGNELLDDAVICPKCGCAVEGMRNPEAVNNRSVPYTACLVYSDDCVVLRQNGTRRTRKHRV